MSKDSFDTSWDELVILILQRFDTAARALADRPREDKKQVSGLRFFG